MAVVHAIKPGKIVIPAPSFYGYEKAANVTEAEVSYYEMKERDGFCLTEVFLQELQENVMCVFILQLIGTEEKILEAEKQIDENGVIRERVEAI